MAADIRDTPIDDPFDDEDLLDFESRERRELLAAKMRQKRRVSTTLLWARIVMYIQLLSPMLLLFGTAAVGGGGEEPAEGTTTTTTLAQQQAQGGGGMGVAILGALIFYAMLIFVASRLSRASASARILALAAEGLILLVAATRLAGGAAVGTGLFLWIMLGGLAVVIIVLLLSPSARKGVDANVGDTSARFDIRNLPTLEP